jgi:hypothetical protein
MSQYYVNPTCHIWTHLSFGAFIFLFFFLTQADLSSSARTCRPSPSCAAAAGCPHRPSRVAPPLVPAAMAASLRRARPRRSSPRRAVARHHVHCYGPAQSSPRRPWLEPRAELSPAGRGCDHARSSPLLATLLLSSREWN